LSRIRPLLHGRRQRLDLEAILFARIAPALTVACAGLLWFAYNSCPFGLVNRIGASTLLRTIGACRANPAGP